MSVPSDALPFSLGDFVIESLIGEGGMGKVYRARQLSLDRWVAVKMLFQASKKQDFIARFNREAKLVARLAHSNIVQIYTIGEHEGIPYFAMEYIEGVDLECLFRCHPEPFTVEETIEVARGVTRALTAAASNGIVHRDIKPGNIMITKDGLVKVMDFGLAKGLEASPGSSDPALIVGTPLYMSPEQGASGRVDIRSDIYSLGCVLYECLCDHPPFQADSIAALIFKHAHESPAPPGGLRADLLPEVESMCLKLLAKDPAQRYQSPEELLSALAPLPFHPSLGEMLLARRVGTLLRARRPESIRIKRSAALAAAIAPSPENGAALPGAASPRSSGRILPVSSPSTAARPSTPPPAPPCAARTEPQPEAACAGDAPAQYAAAASPGSQNPPVSVARADAPPIHPAPAPPVRDAAAKTALAKLHESFGKLPDGRWSYRTELSRCDHAEGLAAVLKLPPGEASSGLGDCLLCPNWNKRVGCALACSYELEARHSGPGLDLVTEQALAWGGAERFDMAIALLGDYVKNHPEDPAGFRELARAYDHPGYRGRDKRRAIVLYQRFVELAGQNGRVSTLELGRAEERAAALRAACPEAKGPAVSPAEGLVFHCFYQGRETCFAFGILTLERLVLARAGEADPHSGRLAAAVFRAGMRGTSLLRRFTGGSASQQQIAQASSEAARLAGLALGELLADSACLVDLALGEICDAARSIGQSDSARRITVKAAQTHQLLFPEASTFKADQCYELLRRKLVRP